MRRLIPSLSVALLVLAVAAPLPSLAGEGPVIIDINGSKRDLFKIAVPKPVGDAAVAQSIADVVSGDLAISGWFKVIDPKSFLANLTAEGTGLVVQDWRNVGAEGVSKGRATVVGDELALELKLYEMGHGDRPVLEKSYRGARALSRGFAHQWSNEVVRYFTGEDGFFTTRIAFAEKTGTGHKDLFTMDYDGSAISKITSNGSQNILPAWSPTGAQIAFTSFMRGNPDLYVIAAGGGRGKRISDRPGINIGAAWSPDGSKLAVTLSQDGNPEIYLLGADGSIVKRLTDNPFIDSSPAWSPDGSQIAFVSNHHGSPQIWIMSATGAGQTRLTRQGNYNQEPQWCPKCAKPTIAFTGRDEHGVFDCYLIDVASGQLTRLTENQGSNEHPSWAPNGRALAIQSTRGGIWLTTADGKVQRQAYKGPASSPTWGPASRR